MWQPVDETRGRVEEREHRVEVAVGSGARRATSDGCAGPTISEPAALPERPEDVLDGGSWSGDRGPGGGEQACHTDRRSHAGPVEGGELGHIVEGRDEQATGGAAPAGRQLVPTQLLTQATQRKRIGPAERSGDELGRQRLIERRPPGGEREKA